MNSNDNYSKSAEHNPNWDELVPLRLACAGISLLSILSACYYVNTSAHIVGIYVLTLVIGSYVGYRFRKARNFFVSGCAIFGTLVVVTAFAIELLAQSSKVPMGNVVPFVHVLIRLLILHTFDLKGRADINVSCLIALGLFSLTATIATDSVFGLYSCLFICLFSVFLYLDCLSSSYESTGLIGAQVSPLVLPNAPHRRGHAVLFVSTLPLISFMLFLAMPRVDSLMDLVFEAMARTQLGRYMQIPQRTGYKSNITSGPSLAQTRPGTEKQAGSMAKVLDKDQPRNASVNPGIRSTKDNKNVGGKEGTTQTYRPKLPGSNEDPHKKESTAKRAPATGTEDSPYFSNEETELIFRKSKHYNGNKLLFTVSSPNKLYIKRLSFDGYDGHRWFQSHSGKQATCEKLGGTYQELAGVPSLYLPSKLCTTEIIQNYVIETDLGRVIPAAWTPERISYPEDPITVDGYGTLRAKNRLKKGVSYTVVSELPMVSLKDFQQAVMPQAKVLEKIRRELAEYLKLPTIISSEVKELAYKQSGNKDNWFARVENLSSYLKTNYKYSLKSPSSEAPYELVHHFLFITKEGSCGEYASALVVMCRLVGIPARCVAGFTPSEMNPATGLWEVRAKHSHAWVEVYLPQWGWMGIDPTPEQTRPTSLLQSLGMFFEDSLRRLYNQGGSPNGNLGIIPISKSKPKLTDWIQRSLVWNTWQKIILVILAVPAVLLLLRELSTAMKRFEAKQNTSAGYISPSTQIYLDLMQNLKTVKITRLASDTSEDVSTKVQTRAVEATGDEPRIDPELSLLIKRFMEMYSSNRFSNEGETHESARQLKEIGSRIHSMLKTMVCDHSGTKL